MGLGARLSFTFQFSVGKCEDEDSLSSLYFIIPNDMITDVIDRMKGLRKSQQINAVRMPARIPMIAAHTLVMRRRFRTNLGVSIQLSPTVARSDKHNN